MGDCAPPQTLTPESGSRLTTIALPTCDARFEPRDGRRLDGAHDDIVALQYCDIETLRVSAEDCIAMLPEDEKTRARRFLRDVDRLRFCVGKLMVRTLLAAHTGRTPQSIELGTGPNAKPCMKDGPSFNLSHSGSTVLVGIAESGDLGVDVEAVKAIGDIDSLARSCFSDREMEALAARSAGDKLRAFLRAWTRKEAFVKALGAGLQIDLRSFSVSLEDTIDNALLDAQACCPDADSWSILPARLPGAFEAAVAWNRPRFALHVSEFDFARVES
jgi:4'-phosphopantetheinyl transferase